NNAINFFSNRCFAVVWGGYSMDTDVIPCRCLITDFSLEKVMKPACPWALPKPLLPTPPNGSPGWKNCIAQSLIQTPPDDVDARSLSISARVLEKTYRPSGFG